VLGTVNQEFQAGGRGPAAAIASPLSLAMALRMA
jgi:hypothetical protein